MLSPTDRELARQYGITEREAEQLLREAQQRCHERALESRSRQQYRRRISHESDRD